MKGRAKLVVPLLMMAALGSAQAPLVKEILVKGNQTVSRDAILAAMRTKVGQPYVQATLDADRQAIEDLGFFQAVNVTSRILDDTNREVTVEVVEWPVIKEFRIVGNKAVKTEEILKEVELQVGQLFNANRQVASARRIEDLYVRKGYFAQVTEFAPLRESPGTVSIVITELVVNSVAVQGNLRTRDAVLRRLVKTRAGDTFSLQKWQQDLRRLLNTQWFEDVKSQDSQPDLGKVDLVAQVKETRTGIFNIGLQVDPRSTLAGVLKVTDTNFNGTGQTVGIDLLQGTGGGGTSIELNYANPFFDNKDTSFQISGYSRLVYRFAGAFGGNNSPGDDKTYYERRTGGALGFSRPITDNDFVSIGFRSETIKTSGVNRKPRDTDGDGDIDDDDNNIRDEEFIRQDGSITQLSLGYTRNNRDFDLDPAKGNWFRVELEPGWANITRIGGAFQDPKILGDNNFLRTNLEYRHYFTVGEGRSLREIDKPVQVIATRLRLGLITGDVPYSEQYFVGGSNTLRGYDEDRFWGKKQLVATLEYRRPIQKAFNAILFADYGGAWGGYSGIGDFTQSGSAKFHLGFGIGFSFRTPLGPIRLDFGFNDKGKSRTHFLIGTSF